MANVVVIGAQWGDEGKGKIVDWLSERADIVVRFQGGHNAGHTLVIGNQTYKLSLLPSGVVRPGKLSVIGNGVVVDPWALGDEIGRLEAQGVKVDAGNLRIAENATLILPLHRELDQLRESAAGEGQDRHHRARHRAGLRGQGWAPGDPRAGPEEPRHARPQDRSPAGASQRAAARARQAGGRAQCAGKRAARDRAAHPALRRQRVGPAGWRASRRQAHPVRGRTGRPARRRPRHLSVRDVVEHGGGAGRNRLRHGAPLDRLRAGSRQGLYDARRLRAVPDRADGRDRCQARRARAGVRRGDGTQAPLRLVRRLPGAAGRARCRASTASP